MIGRGTRLRPDLFAPGAHKKHFMIFDICDNFTFFNESPEGIKSSSSKSLFEKVFELKLKIITTIRNNKNASEVEDVLGVNYTNQLHKIIVNLEEARFEVQKNWRLVTEFKNRNRWNHLNIADISDICEQLSGLSVAGYHREVSLNI